MSYDIRVVRSDNKETITLKDKHGLTGGTYCVGGTEEAWLNITYNYCEFFYKLWPEPKGKKEKDTQTPFGQMFGKNDGGIRSLYGKPLNEVIKLLSEAVNKLHGEPDKDYWAKTEGNAREALFKLKLLCEMCVHENPELAMELAGD